MFILCLTLFFAVPMDFHAFRILSLKLVVEAQWNMAVKVTLRCCFMRHRLWQWLPTWKPVVLNLTLYENRNVPNTAQYLNSTDPAFKSKLSYYGLVSIASNWNLAAWKKPFIQSEMNLLNFCMPGALFPDGMARRKTTMFLSWTSWGPVWRTSSTSAAGASRWRRFSCWLTR